MNIKCKSTSNTAYLKIMVVIRSCKTLEQLKYVISWVDRVTEANSLPLSLTKYIILALRQKKVALQKEHATKYN